MLVTYLVVREYLQGSETLEAPGVCVAEQTALLRHRGGGHCFEGFSPANIPTSWEPDEVLDTHSPLCAPSVKVV